MEEDKVGLQRKLADLEEELAVLRDGGSIELDPVADEQPRTVDEPHTHS
jgi:hypothetical protein